MDKDYAEVLSKLKKGEKAIIKGFATEDMPVKLFEMGVLPGVELELLFTAPFCDPLCISYGKGRCCLALRKDEAENVFVERLP
ncbi:MAG: FeoA family protein [Flavobacteriales bacterium AspAUS03]